MNTDARILITGAGGFIGGWLAESMYVRGYRNVRSGVRRWSSGARIARFPLDVVLCDVLNPAQVEQAMEGIEYVIHCAIGSREANVRGTENILKAALAHGVKRVVHFSTVDVYGTTEGTVDESTPLQVTGSVYGDSKIDAENLCRQYGALGLPIVIFRPSIVYGPYCKLWISKFAERLQSGNWGIFQGTGEGNCNLIYIGDLVDAVVVGLDHPRAAGDVFNLNGPEIISWNEYFIRLNDALGFPPLRTIAPGASKIRSRIITPLKGAARFMLNHYGDTIRTLYRKYSLVQMVMKQTERSMKTTPSNAELSAFGRKPSYSIEKLKNVLGFQPSTSIDAGLRMSSMWLMHETLITHDHPD